MVSRENDQTGQGTNWIRRTARIWSVPLLLYALLMATGYGWSWLTTGTADPYAVEDVSFFDALPPVLSFLGVMGLGIAWRWERLGGTIAVLLQLATALVALVQWSPADSLSHLLVPMLLALVAGIPGVLFLLSGSRSGRAAG